MAHLLSLVEMDFVSPFGCYILIILHLTPKSQTSEDDKAAEDRSASCGPSMAPQLGERTSLPMSLVIHTFHLPLQTTVDQCPDHENV